jgi:methylphosphotriester-DNA--protein-cysteine methyltransferase
MAHCRAAVESRHPAGETFRYLATSAMRRNGTRACLRGSSRIRTGLW